MRSVKSHWIKKLSSSPQNSFLVPILLVPLPQALLDQLTSPNPDLKYDFFLFSFLGRFPCFSSLFMTRSQILVLSSGSVCVLTLTVSQTLYQSEYWGLCLPIRDVQTVLTLDSSFNVSYSNAMFFIQINRRID
jgi:hypothetical protein